MSALARVDQARPGMGPLSPGRRDLLQAVIAAPTPDNWRAGRSLVINECGFVTLWQAVRNVDPSCPADGDTPYTPTAFTVRRAIARATAKEGTR